MIEQGFALLYYILLCAHNLTAISYCFYFTKLFLHNNYCSRSVLILFVCAIVDCTGTKIKIEFLSLDGFNELKGQDAVNKLGTLDLPP